MSRQYEVAGDGEDVNRQLLFDVHKKAQNEEQYAEMLLSDLGDPDLYSHEGSFGNEEVDSERISPPPAAPTTGPVPSYMQPTMASVLPPYLQGEIERVRNSYRTGSYNSIKKLPSQIMPGQIRETRKHHITENLLLNSNNVFKPSSNKNEPFQRPEYIGTDYDKMKNLHKYWLEEEKVQTDSLSRKPFVTTSRVRSKTEDIFFDPEYRFPDMGPGTGLRRLESMVRDNNNSDKILLEPGYVLQHKLGVGSGLVVKQWTQKIHAKLVKDWPQYQFRVKFTKSNELIVQFVKPPYASAAGEVRLQSAHDESDDAQAAPGGPPSLQLNPIFPPPNNALNRYMHQLATHGLAGQFGLKKRGDRWNIYEVEYLSSTGSVDGTIPTYGTDPNSPVNAALRRSSSYQGCVTPNGSTSGSQRRATKADVKTSPGEEEDANHPHKSVRWFTRSSSSLLGTAQSPDGGAGAGADTSAGIQREASPGSAQAPHGILHHPPHGRHSAPPALLPQHPYTPSTHPAEADGAPLLGPRETHASDPSLPTAAPTVAPAIRSQAGSPTATPGQTTQPTPRSSVGATPRSVSFAVQGSGDGIGASEGVRRGSPGSTGHGQDQSQGHRQRNSPSSGKESKDSSPGGPAPALSAEQRHPAHPRPPQINTQTSGTGEDTFPAGALFSAPVGTVVGEGCYQFSDPPSTRKVHYLTFSFYAPWIHTGHMNVRRALGYSDRLKAQKYGDKYHQRYSLKGPTQGRNRVGTEDSISDASKDSTDGPGNNDRHTYNIYGSFKSDYRSEHTSTASTPQHQGRVSGGLTREHTGKFAHT